MIPFGSQRSIITFARQMQDGFGNILRLPLIWLDIIETK